MRVRACLSSALPAVMLLVLGCQRLNDERTVELGAGQVKEIGYSAPRYEQKLTVSIRSPGSPVTVYVVRQDDSDKAQAEMDRGKAPSGALAGKEKAEEFTLEATVPEKTAFALLVQADKKKAEVQVKVTGR